jgi:hypothetical protein
VGFALLYPPYIYICDAKGKTEAAQALVRAHSRMERLCLLGHFVRSDPELLLWNTAPINNARERTQR